MNRLAKDILIALAFVLVLTCLAEPASACPTCKDGMAGDPAYSSMVNGYFWSILFMMSMPFLVFSSVAAYFYYEVCRARSRQAAAVAKTSVDATPDASAGPDIALQS
ncbi:MAG: hypothetical protein H6821_03125 [Planctomycetaceae bacterium]|nr:hypothetical protein [Planctomycetales bacterium]MCB9873148.1 hypothetical protein [Planctomycetaceae bacterium]MCB9937828.1 hypothetical protein [Planctomycetaceae bacterium]HRX78925.1 hypothetical protein [Pirellulaceae bacterium]